MKKNDKAFARLGGKYIVEVTIDNIYEYSDSTKKIVLLNEDLQSDKAISSIVRVDRSTFDQVLIGNTDKTSNTFIKKCIAVGYRDKRFYKFITKVKLFFQ